jgi:molecular chaperone DnaJ
VPLSVPQAAMGAEIRVPTMDGEHTLKIPEGTQPGTAFRIRNKGVPILNGHGKGDLYVEVRVQVPSKLNKRQKELLQELDALSKVDNQPLLRSLLGKMKDMFG